LSSLFLYISSPVIILKKAKKNMRRMRTTVEDE
jgi:hypothetical protein